MLVFGYFHAFQQKNKNIAIPIDLITLCLKYYHHPEYFIDHYPSTVRREFSNNDLTVSLDSNMNYEEYDADTDFGTFWVSTVNNEYVYKWHFRIVQQTFCMMIGVSLDDSTYGVDYGYWT